MTTETTKTVTTRRGQVSYGESGEGPLLVVLHSLLTDRHAFDLVKGQLPCRVVTLDLPGFGGSDPAEASIEAFADSMAAATEEICGDAGPPVVMGNGLGAFVALGMAIRHPDLVARLVLVGCGAVFPEDARPALRTMIERVSAAGVEDVIPIALRRIFTEDHLDGHPEDVAARTRVLAATDPEAFVAACTALHEVDFRDRLDTLEVPTLIVVGGDDAATPPAMAADLHDRLGESTLTVLQGVAHAPQLQDPLGFVAAISGFVAGSERSHARSSTGTNHPDWREE